MLCVKMMHIAARESATCLTARESATCITATESATCITETESITCITETESAPAKLKQKVPSVTRCLSI